MGPLHGESKSSTQNRCRFRRRFPQCAVLDSADEFSRTWGFPQNFTRRLSRRFIASKVCASLRAARLTAAAGSRRDGNQERRLSNEFSDKDHSDDGRSSWRIERARRFPTCGPRRTFPGIPKAYLRRGTWREITIDGPLRPGSDFPGYPHPTLAGRKKAAKVHRPPVPACDGEAGR